MGSMLRSDPMTFCDIYLQPEAAFEILSQLGEKGCVQFIDMTPKVQAFQRNYISEVCRCAEMERRLRYIQSEMVKNDIYIPDLKGAPRALQPNEMIIYENILEKWEDDINAMSENESSLMKNYLELAEMSYVLSSIEPFLGNSVLGKETIFKSKEYGDIGTGGRLFVMTGVVNRSKSFYFEMMLWRISRGNVYYRQAVADKIFFDPIKDVEVRKVAFLVICQGEELSTRMAKVFSGFRANIYPCPETHSERNDMVFRIDDRIMDLERVLRKTKYLRCRALRTVGKQWRMWMAQVKKAKAIYHTMNLFSLDITKNCLIGQCWVPTKDVPRVQDTLQQCSEYIGTNVPSFMSKSHTDSTPPTFHRTNKFTYGFQVLINVYGDAKYGELNPGLYTIIFFPFLFSLMFGDVGHAVILVAFASWMVIKEKQFENEQSQSEIWNIFFNGRYVILLLGLFSVYTGFIYNDFFSKGVVITQSYWYNSYTENDIQNATVVLIDPKGNLTQPYVFGIDPVWSLATNKILLENSIKMKLSIIIGVLHMLVGLVLSFCNYLHFKMYYAVFLQFIPEIIFLCCLFFWLVVLIYYKWFNYSGQHPNDVRSPGCAPQILILFIDMVLMATSKPIDDCEAYMFKGQQTLQTVLVFIALACVPVLLFGSPVYLYVTALRRSKRMKESEFRRYQKRGSADEKLEKMLKEKRPKPVEVPVFCELMIHQAVHTIEFVLSTISHTASYLRLWALSLAHAQLSEMLWEMILSKLALSDRSYVGVPKLFAIFAIWALFTVSILVLMEGLSAFLHTLRLHWVEFMSKFFMGGGVIFAPFSFSSILSKESTDKSDAGCKMRQAMLAAK